MVMSAKTATKSTPKGLELKVLVTLNADVIDHALAFCCTWSDEQKFVAPVWARTRTATIRGLQEAIAKHGVEFFTKSTWRDELTQDDARACLALAKPLRKKFFAEFAGD